MTGRDAWEKNILSMSPWDLVKNKFKTIFGAVDGNGKYPDQQIYQVFKNLRA